VDAQGEAARRIRAVIEKERPAALQLARGGVAAGAVTGAAVEARWRELSAAAKIDRVKVSKDVVRSTARAGRKRAVALTGLRAEVEAVAARALTATAERVADRLHAVLTAPGSPPGAAAVFPDAAERTAAREQAVAASVAAWTAQCDHVAATLDGDSRRVAAAVKAFGADGLGTLLVASAAGSSDAVRLLARVLGESHAPTVASLRDDLADRAAAVVGAELAALLAALDSPHLTDDASTGLRVRLAELRRLT
jgi:hypothetical protein